MKKQIAIHIENAAKIQEQFDTEVFGLPWNKALVGNQVALELIKRTKGKEDLDTLKNWYVDTLNIEKNFSILLSQRSNLAWDIEQRKFYAKLVNRAMLALLLISIVVGDYYTPELRDYLAFILFPLLSLFLLGVETRDAHRKVYKNQEIKEKEIANILEEYHTNPNAITRDRLRAIQDTIYQNRKTQALVPDLIYNWRRNREQNVMEEVIKELIRKQQS